jgi:hypothetical protein
VFKVSPADYTTTTTEQIEQYDEEYPLATEKKVRIKIEKSIFDRKDLEDWRKRRSNMDD